MNKPAENTDPFTELLMGVRQLLLSIRRMVKWVGATILVVAIVVMILELQVSARNADIHKVRVSSAKLEVAVNQAIQASRDAKKVVDDAVAQPTPPAVEEAFRQIAETNRRLLALCDSAGVNCDK